MLQFIHLIIQVFAFYLNIDYVGIQLLTVKILLGQLSETY